MDISTLLAEALRLVDAAEVPDDLRGVAFAKVFDLLSRDSIASVPPPAATAEGEGNTGIGQIAGRLNISPDLGERIYFVDGDRLELVLPVSRLDPKKSRATEQIALLVAAGRQAAGIDDDGWTPVDPIREACENFKKHDPSNFAATIKDMADVFTVRGSGRDRKVRMTAPAWQRAKELVANLGT